jgi:outer membrane protein assembly factor BamB
LFIGHHDAIETQPGIPSSIPGLDHHPIDFLVATSVWIQTDLDAWIAAAFNRVILDWDSITRGFLDSKVRCAPGHQSRKKIEVETVDWSTRIRGTLLAQALRDRCCLVSACVFVLMTLCAITSSRGAPQVAPLPFRQNATLPFDRNLLKRFGTIEDLISDQRWAEAMGILQEIVQTENKGLVLVRPGTPGGVETYLNVATRCNVLMSRVSREGRLAYRQKVDPQAKRWFEAWQRTRDETELLRIIHQAFLSSYGDDAILALGESAWDRGDFSTARSWWEQLVPLPENANPANYPNLLRYPDTEFDQPTILARTVMCSILEREPIRAAEEIRQFSEKYPTAEGWLAGKQGLLIDLLTQSLNESRRWSRKTSIAEIETFACSPARFRRISESIDVGALRWVHQLTPSSLRRPAEPVSMRKEPLSFFPVIYDKIVLVNDGNSIHARNILTGDPAWQADRRDSAVIYPSPSDEPAIAPVMTCVGVPFFTMTIDGHRLYARMGSPVTSSSNRQHRDLESDLVCLDLSQEGKLVWKISSRELFHEDSWRFEGTPVIIKGRAYFAASRRRPQLELIVVCLDASDGHLLWQRPIGGFRSSVEDNYNRVSHLLLTAGGGRVFLSTDVGAIVALDDQDGRLEWAVTYESRTDESVATQSNPDRKTLLPPLFHQGLLFVAPNDADFALCLKADSGQVEWKHPYLTNYLGANLEPERREHEARQRRENQWHHLLGIADGGTAGRLIVSGSSLSAIDVVDGSVVWRTPKIENSGSSRGLLAGDQILLPSRESIEIYSQQTGQRTRKILLNTPDSPQQGGNLTFARGMLLIAQPDRLSAYFEYSVLKERIERDITENSDNPSAQLQLAEIEAAEGLVENAASRIQRIIERNDLEDPDRTIARRQISKLLQDAGTAARREQNLISARGYWQRAMVMADDDARRIELTFDLAGIEQALNHPEIALEHLQTILSDERLARSPRELSSAGQDAADQMARLIAEHGRNAYLSIETAASMELEKLRLTPDAGQLRKLIRMYPHASIMAEARQILAQYYRQTEDISLAYAELEEIRRSSVDQHAFVKSTIAMIELLDDSHKSTATSRLLTELATCDPTIEIVFAGRKSNLGELLKTRIRSNESSLKSLTLERTWSLPLSDDAQIIFPKHQPPSADLASLLICSKPEKIAGRWLWRCVDLANGHVRWEKTVSSPILVAGWNDVDLMIGTSDGWEAITPDQGRLVWTQTDSGKSKPLFAGDSDDFDESVLWPASFDLDHGLRLFDPHNGRIVVTIKPPGHLHEFLGFSHVPNIGDAKRQFSVNDELPKWYQGMRSDASLSKNSVAVLMQTTKPTRTWMATAAFPRSRWSITKIAVDGELWRASPMVVQDRIIGINNDLHMVGQKFANQLAEGTESARSTVIQSSPTKSETVDFSMHDEVLEFASRLDDEVKAFVLEQLNRSMAQQTSADLSRRKSNFWEYQNFPVGQASPIAWKQSGILVAVADGSLLMSFDADNGNRRYTASLSDFPMQNPGNQICTHGDLVFAASQGFLRGISIRDGQIRFEKYLGGTLPQWKTTVAWTARPGPGSEINTGDIPGGHCFLAVWGLNVTDQRQHAVLLCDGETGKITQRLRVESEPRELVVMQDGQGILWTKKSLLGLQMSGVSK